MGQKQTDIDLYKNPFPHLPTSSEMNTTFLSSQPDSASEGPPTSDVPVQSDMVISTVAAQATTAFLVNELTDKLLRSSADMLAKDYDLLMQATCILYNHRIKRSQISKLLKAVVRQKEIVWAHCEDLKKERATLRKTLRKAFFRKPVVNSVKLYTKRTARAHPVNGRLYQRLYGTPPPTTPNTPTQVPKSTKGSAAKKTEVLFDNAEEGYEMDIDDTKGDEGDWEDDDSSDDEDEDYEEDSEEDDEEDDEESEQGGEGEEDDSDDDEEFEEDMD